MTEKNKVQSTGNIDVNNVVYDVEYVKKEKMALITAYFEVSAHETFPAAVSLLLDNHELTPPQLVKVVAGKTQHYILKPLKIFRPIIHREEDGEDVRCYCMSLGFYVANSDELIFLQSDKIYIHEN
ncbi:hypothetical protein AAEX28_14205 [Lentisphaerota bacterium WC36G]|nr:hypothetical protein LJT99_00960 [Lentisphaerae bacterium WC36]